MSDSATSRADQPYRQRRPSGAAMRFDDAEPVTVVLVRHGETVMTAGRSFSGSSEEGPPLTPRGRAQAAGAARAVARVGRTLWPDVPVPTELLASPMVRTRQTADAVSEELSLPVTIDPAFAECDFGLWQGLRPDELDGRWPGAVQRWYEGRAAAPEGESLPDVGARVASGLERLLAQGTGRTVVVASHVMAIRAAVGVSLGSPPTSWTWARILPGSLTVVQWWPDGMREVVATGVPTSDHDTVPDGR